MVRIVTQQKQETYSETSIGKPPWLFVWFNWGNIGLIDGDIHEFMLQFFFTVCELENVALWWFSSSQTVRLGPSKHFLGAFWSSYWPPVVMVRIFETAHEQRSDFQLLRLSPSANEKTRTKAGGFQPDGQLQPCSLEKKQPMVIG